VAYLSRGRKQITIDGIKSRLPELYERFSAVAIGPEDSEILSGPPSARRLFMDLYVSQYSKKYLEELSRYNRIVEQKNAALKEELEFESYNTLLVKSGSEIMKARSQFLKILLDYSDEYYKRFSNGTTLSLVYKPSAVDGSAIDEKIVESEFENRLDEIREKEIIMKTALIGPHRDEIELSVNDMPARTHSSQGEWRSAAIALKLAVYKLLKEKRKFSPLLLLDEVFAELDEQRVDALMNSFVDFEQIFLTTATAPPEQLRVNAKSFKIKNGQIEAAA
jgi:DNA replication and repair protein RecF